MKDTFEKSFRNIIPKGIFILLFFGFQSYAQQAISGQILDEENIPIIGVNITIEGKSVGSTSDFDGNYSISASSGDVLIFSYLGYKTQKITVADNLNISVTLLESLEALDDVVIIGYGTSRKKDLTGAVSQVTAKSFDKQPITRVEEAIQGRAAGVTVARNSGGPGAGAKIRVRGVNSITGNNDPLVVVDGIFGGDLRTINPNDIASIEVLKDASALAIYGSRGSNGVILISTKKGARNTKFKIEQFTTISTLQNQLSTLSTADFARLKNRDIAALPNTQPLFSNSQIANFESNGINYQDEIFQTGLTNNVQVSYGGGDDKFKYFLSGNYVDQEGIVTSTAYERYSLRSNLNSKISDKFSIGINFYGSRETTFNNLDAFDRFKGSPILKALTWDPTSPVKDENGDFILTSTLANNGFNPIAVLSRSNVENFADRLNATANLKYVFFEGLSYNFIMGANTINSNTQSVRVEGDRSVPDSRHTLVNFFNTRFTEYQVSNILNWKKSFGKHNINFTGVYEFQANKSAGNGFSTFDVDLIDFFLTDNGDISREDFFNGGGQTAIQSYLGRVQYDIDKNLFLTASLRVDQSSIFSRSNRTGYFPSAAIAYSFNNMDFIANNEELSNLKIRVGYGEVGNQNIDQFARFARLNNVFSTADGVSSNNGVVESQRPNENLKWETTVQTNVGLDVGFFDDRLNLSIDYYKKNTEDLLLQTRIANSSFTRFENIGEVENKGVDLSISGDVIKNDKFNWNSGFVLSTIKNEVVKLIDGQDEILGNVQTIDGTIDNLNVIQVGEPLGQFYGLTFLGTWKSTDVLPDGISPGDARYLRDENGDRVFGAIGNGTPTLTWGFNNTFSYKNWDLNTFLQASHNFDVYNQVEGAINGGTGDFRDNLSPNSFNVWTPENETDIPRAGSVNLLNSSRYVEDGSFVRLSNVSLGYTFEKLLKGIESVNVYVSGQNLFLITDYSGYDPEVTSSPVQAGSNADVASGINLGAIPNPRTLTVGVKLAF